MDRILAWRVGEDRSALLLMDAEVPEPAPGWVSVRVHAAGICHSDVAVLDDSRWRRVVRTVPITLGHEIAGVVDQLGDGVDAVWLGKRVAVWPMAAMTGLATDGGFAARVLVPERALVEIPGSVPFTEAAVATDAGMTSFHALMRRGRITPDMSVLIIGFGGLGHIATQIACQHGSTVHVVEIRRELWGLARNMGVASIADHVASALVGGIDVVVDFVGSPETLAESVEAVGVGGRIIVVGLKGSSVSLDLWGLVSKGASIEGCTGGSREDIQEVLKLLADHRIRPHVSEIEFAQIGDGVARLRSGSVTGRLVALGPFSVHLGARAN
jgi:propanol-preferring alcohol dehydrogenase